jgi:hypothetical protein
MATMWYEEAVATERARYAAFAPRLAQLNGQLERGLLTVGEFVQQVEQAQAAILRAE